jgi:hypothetical protein
MQSNIKKRLGARWFSPGCLVTLTYAPQRVSKEEAWRNIAADKKRFLHSINTRRYRNHAKGLKYLWAIENQPGTGYPHIHIFFPNLNYFMPSAELNHLWPWGMTDVHHKDNINCASYLCSYLSKLEDWDLDSQSQIWANKTRVYGYTANYKLPLPTEKALVDGSYGGSFRPHFNIEGKICGDKQEVALNLLMGGYKLGSGWEDLYEKNN